MVAKKQQKGRGQLGTVWESEGGKNLTFTVLKKLDNFKVQEQFKLNLCVSLAVQEALSALSIPNVKVKWPNDILSGSHKICGILIENMLKGQFIKSAVIGIGLNVNQTKFDNLEKASSLTNVTGLQFDLDEVLGRILSSLKYHLNNIQEKTFEEVLPEYEKLLFRKDKASTFKNEEDHLFMGIIRGISEEGKLLVELEDEKMKEFSLKEVSLQY